MATTELGQLRAVEEVINRMVREIVERFRPEAVILFGSHARGEATPESDVDFLVVTRAPQTRRAVSNAIRRALYPREVPIDVIVVTPEQFARDRDTIGTLVRLAVRDGRVLYARAA